MVAKTSVLAQPWISRQNGRTNTKNARSWPKSGSADPNGVALK